MRETYLIFKMRFFNGWTTGLFHACFGFYFQIHCLSNSLNSSDVQSPFLHCNTLFIHTYMTSVYGSGSLTRYLFGIEIFWLVFQFYCFCTHKHIRIVVFKRASVYEIERRKERVHRRLYSWLAFLVHYVRDGQSFRMNDKPKMVVWTAIAINHLHDVQCRVNVIDSMITEKSQDFQSSIESLKTRQNAEKWNNKLFII